MFFNQHNECSSVLCQRPRAAESGPVVSLSEDLRQKMRSVNYRNSSEWGGHKSSGEEQTSKLDWVEFHQERTCENAACWEREQANDLGGWSGWIENKLFGITLHIEE